MPETETERQRNRFVLFFACNFRYYLCAIFLFLLAWIKTPICTIELYIRFSSNFKFKSHLWWIVCDKKILKQKYAFIIHVLEELKTFRMQLLFRPRYFFFLSFHFYQFAFIFFVLLSVYCSFLASPHRNIDDKTSTNFPFYFFCWTLTKQIFVLLIAELFRTIIMSE